MKREEVRRLESGGNDGEVDRWKVEGPFQQAEELEKMGDVRHR